MYKATDLIGKTEQQLDEMFGTNKEVKTWRWLNDTDIKIELYDGHTIEVQANSPTGEKGV